MGYYTTFSGEVSGPSELMEVFNDHAEKGETFGQYDFKLSDWNYDEFGNLKWYGWEEDLTSLSAEYPGLLFEMTGEGEESGDMWKAYARNGKVITIKAKVVFPKPDLDTELPSPDVQAMIDKAREAKRSDIDKRIAELEAIRERL